jgi:hypothetical protein
VQILADGAVEPEQVVTGGAITLEVAASVVHVGLGFTSDLRTLPLAIEGMQGAGQRHLLRNDAGAQTHFENLPQGQQKCDGIRLKKRIELIKLFIKYSANPDIYNRYAMYYATTRTNGLPTVSIIDYLREGSTENNEECTIQAD